MPVQRFAVFENYPPDFENRYKHRFKTTAGAMKCQSI